MANDTHVYAHDNAERMVMEVRVVRRDDQGTWILHWHGDHVSQWERVNPGDATVPTYSIPHDILTPFLMALGMPHSDSHQAEALRVERGRVDKLMDAMTEAVTRGL